MFIGILKPKDNLPQFSSATYSMSLRGKSDCCLRQNELPFAANRDTTLIK